MPPKGKRRSGLPQPRPVSPTRKRKRDDEPMPPSRWSWVKQDTKPADQLSAKHLAWACGFAEESGLPVCANKFSGDVKHASQKGKEKELGVSEVAEDARVEPAKSEVIDLTAPIPCTKKRCRDNPNCLNYMGQELWENEEDAKKAFVKVAKLGVDPRELNRDPDTPVGLRNLGATCYANAFIQVWFQDLAFRSGVYACKPTPPPGKLLEDAPLFQLQATFAALQQCALSVYNPVKLVESLGLRTSEQQDATEFGKLFMNLLGEQFQMQDTPSVKTLLSDQFQGQLTYCTTCKGCGVTSERDSPFLELELSLGSKSRLEERILEVLQKEELTGDNQYMCSRCDSLMNATRWVKLRECPPVLHFSLMRFVYDIKTYERKKSKQFIQFPLTLNMRPFISGGGGTENQTYELRGVLLHRGASAYHGHYVAQAYDVSRNCWFEFNDEDVSRIDKQMEGKSLIPEPEPPASFQASTRPKSSSKARQAESARKGSRSQPKDGEDSEDESPIRKGKKSDQSSDEEIEEAEQSVNLTLNLDLPRYVRSKDAYMLIYARRDAEPRPHASPCSNEPSDFPVRPSIPPIEPPPEALKEVSRLNEEHHQACEEYAKREQIVLDSFARIRSVKRQIYESWHIRTHDEKSVVVSTDGLRSWLMQGLDIPNPVVMRNTAKDPDIDIVENAPPKSPHQEDDAGSMTPKEFPTTATLEATTPSEQSNGFGAYRSGALEPETELHLSDADSAKTLVSSPHPAGISDGNTDWLQGTIKTESLCQHGLIVPPAGGLKRISQPAYERLLESGVQVVPALWNTDVCNPCSERILTEHIYSLRHPQQVKVFHDRNVRHDLDDTGYWISKQWLRDWSSSRPKMHEYGQYDPPPDSAPWKDDVVCAHGNLKISERDRKLISAEAYRLLRTIYPDWETLTSADDICAACEVADSLTSSARERARKMAETERVRLKTMFNPNPLSSRPVSLIEGFSYAVIPAAFIRSWRLWLMHPTVHERPALVDTSSFFCPHDKLLFDPNEPVDMDDVDLIIIKESEWNALSELYDVGKLIRLESITHIDIHETVRNVVSCNQDVCAECRRERKSAFEEAPVNIYLMDITDPLPIGQPPSTDADPLPSEANDGDLDIVSLAATAADGSSPAKPVSILDAYGYGKGSNLDSGVRKSKRLRQGKQRGVKRTLIVRKVDTVKDIKVHLFDLFSIPTICQRLFHGGREITDMNDQTVGELGILSQDTISLLEVKPIDEDEDEEGRPKKKRREEGRAFGGTLLSSSVAPPTVDLVIPNTHDTAVSDKPVSGNLSNARVVAEAVVPSPDPPSSKASADLADFIEGIQCPTCTFINPLGVSCCTMCDTPFSAI